MPPPSAYCSVTQCCHVPLPARTAAACRSRGVRMRWRFALRVAGIAGRHREYVCGVIALAEAPTLAYTCMCCPFCSEDTRRRQHAEQGAVPSVPAAEHHLRHVHRPGRQRGGHQRKSGAAVVRAALFGEESHGMRVCQTSGAISLPRPLCRAAAQPRSLSDGHLFFFLYVWVLMHVWEGEGGLEQRPTRHVALTPSALDAARVCPTTPAATPEACKASTSPCGRAATSAAKPR